MDDSQPQISFAAARARFGSAPRVIIRLVIGLAALSLIGAALTVFMLRDHAANTAARQTYPPDYVYGVLAYDLNDPAPTSYGSFMATAVRLVNSDDLFEVNVSLSLDNRQDSPINVPSLDELRVVNTDGAEATYLGGAWRDDPIVSAHTSTSGEFRFAAPQAGGMLILEYREPNAETPIRVAVGYALEHPDVSMIEKRHPPSPRLGSPSSLSSVARTASIGGG
jgi:hypothetical protein